ncbi:MAG: FkbM family methyltransferase [Verrucomicrobiales bacterium]|nr:FkbM family methyltransferase [Verrucomicrobiales bacterium]
MTRKTGFDAHVLMNGIEAVLRAARKLLKISESRDGRSIHARLYSWVLDILTLGRGIKRCINEESALFLDPRCRFLGNSYEPEVCSWLKTRVKPGDVVMDVGAQFGIYAMFFARWTGQTGHVFAFDPSPEAQRMLQRHLTKNALEDRITIVKDAVGSEDGTALLHAAGSDPQNSLVSLGDDRMARESIQVAVTRLDSFCAERGIKPGIVKIDTEGWELPILRGAGALLKDENITWVVEMHPYAWPDAGYTRADFEALLREHGMEVVPLTGQDDPLATYGDTYLRRVFSARV